MVRRVATIFAVLATACLFYYVAFLLIFIKIMSWCGFAPRRPTFPGYVECAGYRIPWWAVVLLWSVLPGIWLGLHLSEKLRRRRRDKLGLCVECGCRIKVWRGHCPECGVRIGPGMLPRRLLLR